MKLNKMFKMIVITLALTGIYSCGSDNDTTPGAAAPTKTNPLSGGNSGTPSLIGPTATCEPAASYNDFYSRVSKSRFIEQTDSVESYFLKEYVNGYFSRQLERISTKGQPVINHLDNITYVVTDTTRADVMSDLVVILDNKDGKRGSGSYFEVSHSNGDIFGIDLCKPIAANPVRHWDYSSQTEYIFVGGVPTSYNMSPNLITPFEF